MESDGIVTRTTTEPVGVVVERLLAALASRGVEVFAVIDHSGAAEQVGQELRDTKLVVFGNPAVGTALMQVSPLIALDLPLKILIWQQDVGTTCVSYNQPSFLADRHEITDQSMVQTLASVETLTDLIVTSVPG